MFNWSDEEDEEESSKGKDGNNTDDIRSGGEIEAKIVKEAKK